MSWDRRHLLDVDELDQSDLEHVHGRASSASATAGGRINSPREHVALLFAEPSTRTRLSFEMAARRLGAETYVLEPALLFDGQGRDARRHDCATWMRWASPCWSCGIIGPARGSGGAVLRRIGHQRRRWLARPSHPGAARPGHAEGKPWLAERTSHRDRGRRASLASRQVEHLDAHAFRRPRGPVRSARLGARARGTPR